jgi:hypothetical protein
MLLTFSFSKLKSQFQARYPEFDEIRLDKYALEWGAEARKLGVSLISLPAENGDYGVFRVQLTTDKTHDILTGLEILDPVAVTVERGDVPNLVGNDRIISTAMQSHWPEIAPQLERLTVGELFGTVEQVAWRIVSAKPMEVTSTDTQWGRGLQEQATIQALRQAGVNVPEDPFEADDARREAEQAARDAKEQSVYKEYAGKENCPHDLPANSCLVCNS